MKYIIDIEDNAFEQDNCPDMLFRAKGFKSLVFDQNGLDKLSPYASNNDYQRGLNDAWEVVKKISRMDTETAERITGYSSLYNIMNNITPEEAVAKVRAYEQHEQEIRIGDEVIAIDKDSVGGMYEPFIVYKISKTFVYGVGKERGSHILEITDVKKTGRHYDIKKMLLDAIRKDGEE